MTYALYIYLATYVLILFLISYFVSRKQTKEGFLIADRKREGWQIMASKFAAAIGVGYFITYTGFAYEYGLGVFAILAGLIIGFLFFAFWAVPKIYEYSKKRKFYTMGHFVYHKTKSKVSMTLSDIVSGFVLLGWLIVGIIGGGKIISDFGLMSYNLAVIFSASVVLIYLLLAGFKAVVITDILQSAVILILLVIVTLGIVSSENLGSLFSLEVGSLNMTVLLGFLIFGIFHSFSRPDFFQLIYASKNNKEAVKGFAWAIFPVTVVCFFLLLVGLFMLKNIPGLDSGLVFSEALKQFLPASILPIAIVLFFSGIMSSADTNIYAISSHISMHFKKDKKTMIRLMAFCLGLILVFFAILFPDVVDMSLIAGGLTLILPIPVIYLLSNGTNSKKYSSGIISGIFFMLLGIFLFGLTPAIALFPLLGSGIGLLIPFKK